jgi:hypothetical protein
MLDLSQGGFGGAGRRVVHTEQQELHLALCALLVGAEVLLSMSSFFFDSGPTDFLPKHMIAGAM